MNDAPEQNPEAQRDDEDAPRNDAQPGPEASFLQLVHGFVIQTMMQLGHMENPMTGEKTVDLTQARYSIDILGMLQEKTKGNLSEDEEQYLKTALTNLRMAYVETAKGAGTTGSDTDDAGSATSDDASDDTDDASS